MVIKHSVVTSRMVPALASHELGSRGHGTRVILRDLFGNYPVRAKQRGLIYSHVSECERNWRELRHAIAAILLACGHHVSIRVHDAAVDGKLIITDAEVSSTTRLAAHQVRIPTAQRVDTILSRAGLSPAMNPGLWIPTSATSSLVSVRGFISLEAAPTKRAQFISFGIEPLTGATGLSQFGTLINELFLDSTFGTTDPASNGNRQTKDQSARENSEIESPTAKPLRARTKGVDRWPMFYLKIRLKSATSPSGQPTGTNLTELTVQSILDVLHGLVSSWLVSNSFSLSKTPTKHRSQVLESGDMMGRAETVNGSPTRSGHDILNSPKSSGSKRKRGLPSHTHRLSVTQTSPSPLRHVSRIKSGHPLPKPCLVDLRTVGTSRKTVQSAQPIAPDAPFTESNVVCIGRPDSEDSPLESILVDANITVPEGPEDNTLIWEDPLTHDKHRVNARTGQTTLRSLCSGVSKCKPGISPNSASGHTAAITLRSKTATGSNVPAKWLGDILRDWRNPVFRPAEEAVKQIVSDFSTDKETFSGFTDHGDISAAFSQLSMPSANRLSKTSLASARVISQVDEKFILASFPDPDCTASMLVVIDQHAADERVRLEDLFRQLLEAPAVSGLPYKGSLGCTPGIRYTAIPDSMIFEIDPSEAELLKDRAGTFAEWGILYDIEPSQSAGSRKAQQQLTVHTLPTVIAERGIREPPLVISLLRSHAWKLAEGGSLGPKRRRHSTDSLVGDAAAQSWVSRLASCPQGIVDLLNSRACRSAIMFNDRLSRGECEELVRRLARCAFPFQCAHGRPSMVPLIALQHAGGSQENDVPRAEERAGGGFLDAVKRWRERGGDQEQP